MTAQKVYKIRRAYGLKTRFEKLREQGFLTLAEIARRLHVAESTVKVWRRHGLLRALPFNDKNECLYQVPETMLRRSNRDEN